LSSLNLPKNMSFSSIKKIRLQNYIKTYGGLCQ